MHGPQVLRHVVSNTHKNSGSEENCINSFIYIPNIENMRLTAEISHVFWLINGTLSREVSSVRKPGDTSSEILMVFRKFTWWRHFATKKPDFWEKWPKTTILPQQQKKGSYFSHGSTTPLHNLTLMLIGRGASFFNQRPPLKLIFDSGPSDPLLAQKQPWTAHREMMTVVYTKLPQIIIHILIILLIVIYWELY